MEKPHRLLTRDAILTAMNQSKTIKRQRIMIIILMGVIAVFTAFKIKEV